MTLSRSGPESRDMLSDLPAELAPLARLPLSPRDQSRAKAAGRALLVPVKAALQERERLDNPGDSSRPRPEAKNRQGTPSSLSCRGMQCLPALSSTQMPLEISNRGRDTPLDTLTSPFPHAASECELPSASSASANVKAIEASWLLFTSWASLQLRIEEGNERLPGPADDAPDGDG